MKWWHVPLFATATVALVYLVILGLVALTKPSSDWMEVDTNLHAFCEANPMTVVYYGREAYTCRVLNMEKTHE